MSPRFVWGVVVAAFLCAGPVAAQTVYTWKDSSGVVHFSDENPEGVQGVETLTLEAPAPLVSETGEEGGDPSAVVAPVPGGQAEQPEQPGGAGVETEGSAPRGASQVVLVGEPDLSAVSSTQRRVRGRLQNLGGEPARRVSVRVVVADANTGGLCAAGEINADPSELGPGENGTFEGDLNTPCFYANPRVAYYPEWD